MVVQAAKMVPSISPPLSVSTTGFHYRFPLSPTVFAPFFGARHSRVLRPAVYIGALSSDARFVDVICALFASLAPPLPLLKEDGLLQSLVTLLSMLSDSPAASRLRPDKNAACLARDDSKQHVT